MTKQPLNPALVEPVASFLADHLPVERDDTGKQVGWNHMFGSAYQMGCEALSALGYATETDWGALACPDPKPPATLPRWDDICVIVLRLADQRDKLIYRLPDGSVPIKDYRGHAARPRGVQPPPTPNIASSHRLGPAHADADVTALLHQLALTDGSHWTEAAETVLWREKPWEWPLEFDTDPRFSAALEEATQVVPEDVRAEMEKLALISEEDIQEALDQMKVNSERKGTKFARLITTSDQSRMFEPVPLDRQTALGWLAASRKFALEWLFYRRWRLPSGWLTAQEADNALEVFHDSLALAMQREVIARLYPTSPMNRQNT